MERETSKTGQRLMEAFNQFHKQKRNQGPIPGLKYSEIMVLHCIKVNAEPGGQGIKVSEISNILKVTSPSVTQFVKSLENSGYVERNADNADRRAVRIKLTDKGEGALRRVSDVFLASFNGLAEYLGEEKSNQLVEILNDVNRYFADKRDENR